MALCECTCGSPPHEVLSSSLVRGATSSCGCSKERYLKTTGENNVGFKGHREIRSRFWQGYVRGAAQREIKFTITMEYAWDLFEKQGRRCALSGVPLGFGPTRKNTDTTASIDRLDDAEGYVPGNIQWVHKRVNIMRNTLTVPDFVDWCRKVVQHADRVPKG